MYERAAIIGIGLIGGSFALAGRRAGILQKVVGVGRSRATLETAVACGAADSATDDPVAAVQDADLVFLATPVAAMRRIIARIAPAVPSGCLVTDAGSTKRTVMDASRRLPASVDFVGGHPMAGSEQAGVAAARADLFRDCPWLLTPRPGDDGALERMREVVEAVGARPVVVAADAHDRAVARTSHLPHLVAAALCSALGDRCDDEHFIGTGLRDTTRVAAGPTDVWREILVTNCDEVLDAIDGFLDELSRYRDALDRGDDRALTELLDAARECREGMDEA